MTRPSSSHGVKREVGSEYETTMLRSYFRFQSLPYGLD